MKLKTQVNIIVIIIFLIYAAYRYFSANPSQKYLFCHLEVKLGWICVRKVNTREMRIIVGFMASVGPGVIMMKNWLIIWMNPGGNGALLRRILRLML
jgi:hypothetical protein